jgi:hypothetical protein
MKYLVHIRTCYGELSTEAKVIDGRIFSFVPSGYIRGGHADGEFKMVSDDPNYPDCGPECIALGDLILLTQSND